MAYIDKAPHQIGSDVIGNINDKQCGVKIPGPVWWCGKKSDGGLVVVDCGADQVKQRVCRTCGAGWAGQGGPWSLADALQKIRRTVTGKLEQPGTRNTDRMSGDGGGGG